jgi:hypothetical protein
MESDDRSAFPETRRIVRLGFHEVLGGAQARAKQLDDAGDRRCTAAVHADDAGGVSLHAPGAKRAARRDNRLDSRGYRNDRKIKTETENGRYILDDWPGSA